MRKFRIHIETDKITDKCIVVCDNNDTPKKLLYCALEIYNMWHTIRIYSFKIYDSDLKTKLKKIHLISDIPKNITEIKIVESETSKNKKLFNIIFPSMISYVVSDRKSRFDNIFSKSIDFKNISYSVCIIDGTTCENINNMRGWNTIYSLNPVNKIVDGIFYCNIHILKMEIEEKEVNPIVSVGIIEKFTRDYIINKFIGQSESYGYLNNGCIKHYSETEYNIEPYGKGDTIGILLDSINNYMYFFKNKIFQGKLCTEKKKEYHVGFSSSIPGTEFKINWPNIENILGHNNDIHDIPKIEIIKTMNNITKTKKNYDIVQTQKFDKILTQYALKNNTYVWDQQYVSESPKIIFPNFTTFIDNRIYKQSPCCTRTFGVINDCIAFIEFELVKISGGIRVGIINKHLSHKDMIEMNIGPKYYYYVIKSNGKSRTNDRNKYHESVYCEKLKAGNKVGVFFDKIEGTLEILVNGESKGEMFNNITGSYHFVVMSYSNDYHIKISKSGVDEYFKYQSQNKNNHAIGWNINQSIKILNDTAFQVNILDVGDSDNNNDIIECAAMYQYIINSGRRYFEIIGRNITDYVTIGVSNDDNKFCKKYNIKNIHGKDCIEGNEIINFSDSSNGDDSTLEEEEKIENKNIVQLLDNQLSHDIQKLEIRFGVLIDFIDSTIDYYINRKHLEQKRYDNMLKQRLKPFVSYVVNDVEDIKNKGKIPEFEFDNAVEKEMMETLVLYK
jgi:hypothetical protein